MPLDFNEMCFNAVVTEIKIGLKKNPARSRGMKLTFFRGEWTAGVFINLRFCFHRYCAFNQYGYLIVNDFYKTTLDGKKSQVVVFIFQHFHPAGFQRTDKGRMSVQYLEQSVDAG